MQDNPAHIYRDVTDNNIIRANVTARLSTGHWMPLYKHTPCALSSVCLCLQAASRPPFLLAMHIYTPIIQQGLARKVHTETCEAQLCGNAL